ncbi:hypothetical protein [Frankia sp. AgB32]|uniref:hypothetical protein n=1 Tax=Frankia sp. AgB32 TaxID=631119 RepID=UPI00200D10C1|nr:hypothetical protein [Frankia sp. AgB32]MCK9894803.1 hypothetical protein [Frankia sp. AgB32]
MTTTDWILDIVLILVVLRQVREARVDLRFVLLPLGIVSWSAHTYLHSVPTAGNDLVLIALFTLVGTVLGVTGGLATRVRHDGTHPLARAGATAVVLWLVGMGGRLVFQIWASHGGGATLARFSAAHDITTEQAWVTALLLMAFAEVATRIGTIVIRAAAESRSARPELARV